MLLGYLGQKLSHKIKAHIELNLATAIRDMKIFVSFFSAVRGGLRRISSLYWMWGETK